MAHHLVRQLTGRNLMVCAPQSRRLAMVDYRSDIVPLCCAVFASVVAPDQTTHGVAGLARIGDCCDALGGYFLVYRARVSPGQFLRALDGYRRADWPRRSLAGSFFSPTRPPAGTASRRSSCARDVDGKFLVASHVTF